VKAIEKKVAALLLSRGILTEKKLQDALAEYDPAGSFIDMLLARGYVGMVDLTRARAEAEGMAFVQLVDEIASPEVLGLLTAEEAWTLRALPLARAADGAVRVVVADASNVIVQDELRRRTGAATELLMATAADLEAGLTRYYGPAPVVRSRTSREIYLGSVGALSPPPVRDHREHQRRAREFSDTDVTTRVEGDFSPTTESDLAAVEQGRRDRGAYAEPTVRDRSTETQPGEPGNAGKWVDEALDAALQARVSEVALEPAGEPPGAVIRWRDANGWRVWRPISTGQLEAMVARLRRRAGLDAAPRFLPSDHQFMIPSEGGDVLATLFLTPTGDGSRAVVRLWENVPLPVAPLGTLRMPEPIATEVMARLRGRGGGLLLLSAGNARLVRLVYDALISELARAGDRDVLSLERLADRRMPGVISITTPTDQVQLASLANASFMNPDVLGVATIGSGVVLNQLIESAIRGTSCLGGLVAPSMRVAHECLAAARVDAANLVRGVMAHLHIESVPRLCTLCRSAAPMPLAAGTRPAWVPANVEAVYTSVGCDHCHGTGSVGTMMVADVAKPALDGTMELLVRAEPTLCSALRDGVVGLTGRRGE
jgi:type II secretory ATPase GspE/PulE/Tfp pilus assembly ATPase PilB-like protein